MAWLPRIRSDSSEWRLPLCDASAVRLAEAMLAEDAVRRAARLAELLLEEPSLSLWAVCASPTAGDGSAVSAATLADWLSAKGRGSLATEPADEEREEPPDAEAVEIWAELAARAVATRRHLQRTGASPEVQWTALLAHADVWFSTAGPAVTRADCEAGRTCLPSWAAEGIAQSLETAPLETAPPETAAFHADFDEVRRQWLVSIPQAGPLLARLCGRLAHVERLESDFARTLEEEKLAAMKQLAYGAGHEINNPLANISTRAQTLLFDETDPETRRKLATINAQAFRAHEMIADLMLFAMPPALKPEPIDVAALLDGVIDEIKPTADAQQTAITRVGDGPAVSVDADPTQLAVAVKAICVNAIEAIGQGGQIEIELELRRPHRDADQPGRVVIEIRDNGPGIAPETRRHLFDPFYSGREAGRGLGFGLSKAWRIVQLHGGRIDVASEMDRGATFRIWLQ